MSKSLIEEMAEALRALQKDFCDSNCAQIAKEDHFEECSEAVAALSRYRASKEAEPDLVKLCKAARSALRSYQYGNSAPDLAEGIADAIDAALRKAQAHD